MSLNDLANLFHPLDRTFVFALWYATLLWLPARGVAAVIDHLRGIDTPTFHRAPVGHYQQTYAVGMKILPPM